MKKKPIALVTGLIVVAVTVIAYFAILNDVALEAIHFITLAGVVVAELITMAYGSNDWSGVNNEKLEEHARGFLQALRKNYPNTRLVMLATVWRHNWERERPLVAFREIPGIFRKLAAEVGNTEVIDCFDLIPPDASCFSPDILHPNDKGFGCYGEGIVKALKELGV